MLKVEKKIKFMKLVYNPTKKKIEKHYDTILSMKLSHVRRRGKNIHPQNFVLSSKYVETRNSCLLLVKNWNGSRHLVFWSL